MLEVEYSSELKYQVQINCYDDDDGFKALIPFKKSSTAFFDLLGATTVYEEFWKDDEGQKFCSRIVGYGITVIFNGHGGLIYRFIQAAALFFELNDAIKLDEKLYLVEKSKHN